MGLRVHQHGVKLANVLEWRSANILCEIEACTDFII